MAKPQSKEVRLPLELSINESTYNALIKAVGNDQISEPVKDLLEEFLIQYSQGGFVVSANDIARMSQAAGEPISNSKRVVEAVDKLSHRKAGAYEFSVSVDPNMIETFTGIAVSRGMTLEDIVQEAWQSVCAEGWLYAVPTPCQHLIINEAQHAAVRKALGKESFTGSDLVSKFLEVSKGVK